MKRHGLTTIGRKDDKVKAIRCHFFRQTTNPTTDENESDESDTSDGETETESESEDEESDDDVVLADLDLNSINNIQLTSLRKREYFAKQKRHGLGNKHLSKIAQVSVQFDETVEGDGARKRSGITLVLYFEINAFRRTPPPSAFRFITNDVSDGRCDPQNAKLDVL